MAGIKAAEAAPCLYGTSLGRGAHYAADRRCQQPCPQDERIEVTVPGADNAAGGANNPALVIKAESLTGFSFAELKNPGPAPPDEKQCMSFRKFCFSRFPAHHKSVQGKRHYIGREK